MEKPIKVIELVCQNEKSNKLWRGSLFANGTVKTEWGRVGVENLQSKDFPDAGEVFLNKKIKEKEGKGYLPA